MGRSYVFTREEPMATDGDHYNNNYEDDCLWYEDKVEVYQGDRLEIGDKGPGAKRVFPYAAANNAATAATLVPTAAKAAKHHEALDLQVSLWPTFQRLDLPKPPPPPKKKEWTGPPDRRDKSRDEEEYNKALEEQDRKEERLNKRLDQVTQKLRWQSGWEEVVQDKKRRPPVANPSNVGKQKAKTATEKPQPFSFSFASSSSPSSPSSDSDLELPPAPGPLPPCLQCAVAGVCCSLTTTPYARGFINDRISARQPRESRVDITARASWDDACTGLVKKIEKSSTDEGSYTANLVQRRRKLEQSLLKKAITRGDTDSPFLPHPPAQCVQCERRGDSACLQQSRDITNTAAITINKEKVVAWFASSGPPPLSLLPQHNVPLQDQIDNGTGYVHNHVHAEKRADRRQRRQTEAWPLLEAIFCRDPTALSAAQISVKAHSILEKAGKKPSHGSSMGSRFPQKQRGQGGSEDTPSYMKIHKKPVPKTEPPVRIRPATAVEVSRLLPRTSWINVYAGRGVAVVRSHSLYFEKIDGTLKRKASSSLHDYRASPPALPSWNRAEKRVTFAEDVEMKDADPAPSKSLSPKDRDFNWQEHFLNLNEERAAILLKVQQRMEKRKAKIHFKPLPSIPSSPSSSPSPSAPLAHPKPHREKPVSVDAAHMERPETKEERDARIARLALALSDRLRNEEQRILGNSGRSERNMPTPVGSIRRRPGSARSLDEELAIERLIQRLSRSFDLKTSRKMALAALPLKK